MRTDAERARQKYGAYCRAIGLPLRITDEESDRLHAHLNDLNAQGMSAGQIARQTNGAVSTDAVAKIMPGSVKNSHRSIYNALMAVRYIALDGFKEGAKVDHRPTTRRLQALCANGWTSTAIGAQLGVTFQAVDQLTKRTAPIFSSTAYRIAALYGRLEFADPLEYGVTPIGVTRAKRAAAKRGYAPAHTWDPDTIDDPEALPEWTGACGTAQGWAIHKREGIPYCSRCSGLANAPRRAPGASLKEMPEFDGRKLKRLRERRDIGLTELSRMCGVDKSTLTYWEAGRSTPSRRSGKLDVVLATLGATVNDILVLEGE